MAQGKRAGDFNKQITNARNSNDNFEVEINEDPTLTANIRRTSAALLAKSIIHGAGTKKHFTTITPHGLPADLIGNEKTQVERQNVLIEPKGHKNEGARLPPFKPFKTISDEDNIHLLPGETGERARLNLLDTKNVTKKDVEEVKKAYHQQRKEHPELYSKQGPPPLEEEDKPGEDAKKKGLLSKLFGKKKKEEKELFKPPPPPPPPEEPPPPPPPEPEPELPKPPEEKPEPPPKEAKILAQATVSHSASKKAMTKVSYEYEYETETEPSSEYESTSESDEEEQQWPYPYPQYPYPYPQGYPQGPPQYPGFPGGYSPFLNQSYPGGFGPMQAPPCYNPCMEEVQLECCKKLLKEKGGGDQHRAKPRFKKQQGLNFDFLPHDDLATEVTMTIEPDEPEPLQFAVENGIMPIICCYMPSSIAVQPGENKQNSTGYPSTYNYGSQRSSYYPYYSQTRTSQRQTVVGQGQDSTDAEDESLPEFTDSGETYTEPEPIDPDNV